VGALGVVAAGALCAGVLSVASRVPPTPIDTEQIPAIQIGGATKSDVAPAVRRDRPSNSRRRHGKRASDARDRRAGAGGSALPVAYRDSGAGQNAIGAPPPGDLPNRPVSGTGPGAGSGGDGPGAPGNRGGGRQPAGGGGGGSRAQPRNVSAPAPAPAPAQPAGGEEAIDDDAAPAPAGTAASEGEGEVETGTEPAAAIPAPTLARSGDSDDE
jgi:hypothetical protein